LSVARAGIGILSDRQFLGLIRSSTQGVYANLATGVAVGQGTDTLSGIENPSGSNFADTLVGDDGPNLLMGGPGRDILDGGRGSDELRGGMGADTCLNGETLNSC